ncbi:D-alanyl-D-alanine-carboxypeptidase/endopeptidase AmpH [Taklimakanibacter deserti]|uniref:D-alanyl-D-alanine- carboxypeptidase/endopeptidase AmpH n=1 Tax=Taklimakanibacter deserti TaxID=2267839 RepID=UPI000E6493CA
MAKKLYQRLTTVFGLAAALSAFASISHAEDKLLKEAVEFNGVFIYLNAKVPGLIFGAVRNGETAFAGFGETAKGSGKEPDADSIFRIGSISKAFCGSVLTSLVIDGKVELTDRLQDRMVGASVPEKDGHALRLLDLVTQTSGLPREVPRPDAPPDDPFSTNTRKAALADLKKDPFLFPPGTAALYSNYGFDLLGYALADISGKPYADVLRERVLDPLGMKDTSLNPPDEAKPRIMQGHNFDGSPMPTVPSPASIGCSGGLYTTANDMLRWMRWHLDRSPSADSEERLVNHGAYVYRDGLTSVLGLDDGGPMGAMGLGWVITFPDGDRPLILEKSGGLQGFFAYVALAPTRGVGAFFVMNEFSTGGFTAAVEATNEFVTSLAPR